MDHSFSMFVCVVRGIGKRNSHSDVNCSTAAGPVKGIIIEESAYSLESNSSPSYLCTFPFANDDKGLKIRI